MIAFVQNVQIGLCLAAAGVGLFLSAAYSGIEIGGYRLSEVRLRVQADRHGGGWKRLLRLLQPRDRFICILIIGNNVAHYVITASTALLFSALQFTPRQTEFYSTVVLTPILFLFAEMIPKAVFQARADSLTVRFAWVVAASRLLFTYTGLLGATRGATAAVMRLFGHRGQSADFFASRDRLLTLLLDQTASGVLSPVQYEVARNVMDSRAVLVREIATPIEIVAMIDEHADREQIEDAAAGNDFSRLLVHRTGDPRQIIGYVNLIDALLCEADDDLVRRFLRPVVQLAADQPITAAMLSMQQSRSPLAIVVDRKNRVIGIATLKTLAERVVGELEGATD